MPKRVITQVHADDIKFCVHLGKQFTDEIGFLSTAALEHYAACGGVFEIHENRSPAGYVAGKLSKGNQPRLAQIYQAAIAYDLQRRELGLAVVSHFERAAASVGAAGVQLWCATDIEANLFWQAAGYSNAGERPGGRRRGRKHILWQKALTTGFGPIIAKPTHQDRSGRVQRPLFDLDDLPWPRPAS